MHTQTSMPWVGFKPTIPASERAKTVHALDRVATLIGNIFSSVRIILRIYLNALKVNFQPPLYLQHEVSWSFYKHYQKTRHMFRIQYKCIFYLNNIWINTRILSISIRVWHHRYAFIVLSKKLSCVTFPLWLTYRWAHTSHLARSSDLCYRRCIFEMIQYIYIYIYITQLQYQIISPQCWWP
jgi:hypothetical protein